MLVTPHAVLTLLLNFAELRQGLEVTFRGLVVPPEPAFGFAGSGFLAGEPCFAVLQGVLALSLHFSEQTSLHLEMGLAVESRNLQNRAVVADGGDVVLHARVDADGCTCRYSDVLGCFLVDKGYDQAAGFQG